MEELERLREMRGLSELLEHYADAAGPDRHAWRDRLPSLGEFERRELVRLHGELLASGWVEQNTGMTPGARAGEVPACYRVTPAGVRALKAHRVGEAEAA